MTTARIRPEGKRPRHHCTGAAVIRFVVNVPPADALWSATSTARSGAPDGLIPAVTPAARKPSGTSRLTGSLMGYASPSLHGITAVDEERRPRDVARRLG